MSQKNKIEAKILAPTTDFLPSDGASCSALEVLANVLEMPADELRDAARSIRDDRKKIALLEKLKIIREGNTAILPTGEIVPRGTLGAMDYPTAQAAPCREAVEAAKKVPMEQIPDAIRWTESYLETLKVRSLVSSPNVKVSDRPS